MPSSSGRTRTRKALIPRRVTRSGGMQRRFMPGLDWRGLEAEMMTGWHRKQHIHRSPFYYVEYGLAQLGAVQVWRNALTDQAASLANYRRPCRAVARNRCRICL